MEKMIVQRGDRELQFEVLGSLGALASLGMCSKDDVSSIFQGSGVRILRGISESIEGHVLFELEGEVWNDEGDSSVASGFYTFEWPGKLKEFDIWSTH